jgi:hypothetical protein
MKQFLHFELLGWSRSACGFTGISNHTEDPEAVTCKNCRRTELWKSFHTLKSLKYTAKQASSVLAHAENSSAT